MRQSCKTFVPYVRKKRRSERMTIYSFQLIKDSMYEKYGILIDINHIFILFKDCRNIR